MSDADVEYGTRWRVLLVALLAALVVVGGLGTALATGTLALTFTAESGTLSLSTAGLDANDLGIAVVKVPTANAQGYTYDVRLGVGDAKIDGLCISQEVSILGKPFTLVLRGGDSDPNTFDVTAQGLLIDLTGAQGQIDGGGELQVNKNAADVTLGSSGLSLDGTSDRFGLQAAHGTLRGIDANVRSITIPNLLTVPDFKVSVEPGKHPCEHAS